MKTLLTLIITMFCFTAFGQVVNRIDTVSTTVNFGSSNMARFKQLEDSQRKYDSLISVQKSELLDVILSSHNIELKDVVKIEPKQNGNFVIKTKKK